MGNNMRSKVIEVDCLEEEISNCEQLSKRNCPVYGELHLVRYQNMEFYLGESRTRNTPASTSIHFLLVPNLLVIPKFKLLQQTTPQSLDDLLDIMLGVAALFAEGQIGMGYGRIAYTNKWGVSGQKSANWAYQEIFRDCNAKGIYLSPQQMLALSQQKLYPKINIIKSDMFTLGIMLLEIIFQQSLAQLFDYSNFQISLYPIIEKLNIVRSQFGEAFYTVMLKMLELEQKDRIDIQQLIDMLQNIKLSKHSNSYMSSSNTSNQNTKRTSRNDVSPLRGLNGLNRPGKTPERNRGYTNKENTGLINKSPLRQINNADKSPLKRDLRINTRFDKENSFFQNGMLNNTSKSGKPSLARIQGFSPLSRR